MEGILVLMSRSGSEPTPSWWNGLSGSTEESLERRRGYRVACPKPRACRRQL